MTDSHSQCEGRNGKSQCTYFDDGVRRVDMVIAFETKPSDEKEEELRADKRRCLVNNLKEKGLELEDAVAVCNAPF